jgi:LacI family transcriptional regulator
MSKVSLTKISEMLGMSKSTVSKALNNYADVSPSTRKKVQDLADELNYKPNIFAQNLRSQKSKIIGLLIPEIVHYFFSTIISGVTETAEKYGYSLIVAQTKDDYKSEIKQLELLLDKNVDRI